MFAPNRYTLVERTRMDSIFDEFVFNSKMPVEKATELKLKGVDYIVLGTIQKRENSIRIDARIVSVENSSIVSIGTTTLPLTDYTKALYNDYPDNTQEFEATIYANREWQIIPQEVKAPAQVEISAKGSWGMTNKKIQFGAEGREENPSQQGDFRLNKNFNHGQLLCRLKEKDDLQIKRTKQVYSIGIHNIDQNGMFECTMNDTDQKNNIGAQIVTIKVTPLNN